MTLKEKLEVEIMDLPIMDEVVDAIGKELEYVADNFAIEFAEWLLNERTGFNMETEIKQLLEIYKKEKTL